MSCVARSRPNRYFSWLVGTGMIVLITATSGVLLDTQDEHAALKARAGSRIEG